MDLLSVIGAVLRVGSCLLCWACVAQYARYRWQDDPIGRHLMTFMLVDAVILSLSSARSVHDGPFLKVVATITFAAFPAVLAQRLVVFRRVQREARDAQAPPPAP